MFAHALSRRFAGPLCLSLALTLGHPVASLAADLSCNGLIEPGQTMICSGFEPNWAIELSCNGEMSADFIDAFSGDGIQTTPGGIGFSSENPWQLETSHPVTGSIAYTPGGCTDESDRVSDFTFTPTAAPGLSPPFFPFCCRIE
ncbi:MAG: hypothetical protein KUA43_03295 [Hoeflea sp.]|nr:hypothetical protein [Alphaproteobacteria bacterium]MBV1722448.1 hypothetical protein [Hoeflea sp.]MBU4543182.1 hypothetical protein [Alphaproteobacteria bacterium]MBU4550278.1 hypothetical protein [Alphaproteobacteria bacterium]MBV1761598.1 hypothetical protein [Hoeflea sp.]